MIKSGIYAILNLLNGKRYIGSAVNLRKRRWKHFCALRKGDHHNIYLQRAFKKYGENVFGWTVLEYVENLDALIPREDLYLKIFWPTGLLYNRCPAAGGTLGCRWEWTEEQRGNAHEGALRRWADEKQCQLVRETMLELWKDSEYRRMMLAANPALRKGFQHSDETKQRDREVMLERWKDPEYRQMQHDVQTGKRRSVETRQRLSESHKKENLSDVTIQKMSDARKRWWARKRAEES